MTTNHKAARRVNEQYHCHHCGKQWDHNDPNPPECKCVGSELYTPKKLYKSDTPGGYYCTDCDRWYCNSSPCLHH